MFNYRLKSVREKNKLSQAALAKKLYVSQQTVGKWETGASSPNPETIAKIADILNVSTDYLLGKSDIPTVQNSKIKNTELPSNCFPITRKKYPLLGEIACGEPIFAEEDRESYIMSGMDIDADFCLRAKGDSMIGARITDGDIVFIRNQPMVDNGEIAAVIIDDEATLKRVYYDRDAGKLMLIPENPKYSPLMYVGEELNNIRILGKAVAFQSDVK